MNKKETCALINNEQERNLCRCIPRRNYSSQLLVITLQLNEIYHNDNEEHIGPTRQSLYQSASVVVAFQP